MSVRLRSQAQPRHNARPRPTLNDVLSIGVGMVANGMQSYNGRTFKSVITVNGVKISTDPENWTPLTVKQMTKLKLNPENMKDFNKKGMTNKADPNAAYKDTVFFSLYSDSRFFVEHLGARSSDETVYYVLARPDFDTNVYTHNDL